MKTRNTTNDYRGRREAFKLKLDIGKRIERVRTSVVYYNRIFVGFTGHINNNAKQITARRIARQAVNDGNAENGTVKNATFTLKIVQTYCVGLKK